MLNLIDRLEALIAEGKRIPWTGRAMVDEREFMEIIDQLRVSLPEELRHARRITQECERLLADAQAEADTLMSAARQQADRLMQDDEVAKQAERQAAMIRAEAERQGIEMVEAAQQHSQQVVTQAHDQAQSIRNGAEDYARDVLRTLKQDLEKQISIVDHGISVLDKPLRDVSPR
ncbi:MAG: hypothetical protein ACYC4L_02075 [Chloroflexota bacterium]